MFSIRLAAQRTASRAATVASPQMRGMATEKQILMQINATKNIKKITASMKMVSAAKLKGDEGRLAAAKPFNAWTSRLGSLTKNVDDATFEELPQKVLIVPFTTERGLCGGINSYITRGVRGMVGKLMKQGKEADIVIIGDKGRAQLRRLFADKILRTATDVHAPGTFALASALSAELIAAGAAKYDAIVLVYNSFINAATYNQKYKVMAPFDFEAGTTPLAGYELDAPDEAIDDLYEYMLASQVFESIMDAAASEQSSRMTAMENASRNATDMIDSLTLRYNRARQSRITTELIEIISGASALDG